jgi:purine-binding chemotaxis protein CheW
VSAGSDKIVIFRLGDDLFGAEVQSVERVVRYLRGRALPDLPPWIDGVIEYRSKVIPQIDLRRRFELPERARSPSMRVLVVNAGGGWIAIVVDAVLEVTAYEASQLSAPPALFRGLAGEYLRGLVRLGDRLIVLLDVERILSTTERLRLDQATAAVAESGTAEPHG